MASEISNYKCPACTAPLRYDGKNNRLNCDYCGSFFTVADIEALYSQTDELAADALSEQEKDEINEPIEVQESYIPEFADSDYNSNSSEWEYDAQGMKVYNCPSCGAQLIFDDSVGAASCPYCGNNSIIPGMFDGVLKPDGVLPFKKTKEEAIAAVKAHYGKSFLLPASFKSEGHISEIKGVYVPFWLFSSTVRTDLRMDAKRVTTHRFGNEERTNTDHFVVRRCADIDFSNVPVDASTKAPDDYMDAIEPFDFSQLKPYSNAYLAGYMADKYDVSSEECARHADERCVNTAVAAVRSSVVGYTMAVPVSENTSISRGKAGYVLLPVWMLTTKWKGKNYLFAMNGQTGKTVGELPVDSSKMRKLRIGLGLAIGAAVYFLGGSSFASFFM